MKGHIVYGTIITLWFLFLSGSSDVRFHENVDIGKPVIEKGKKGFLIHSASDYLYIASGHDTVICEESSIEFNPVYTTPSLMCIPTSIKWKTPGFRIPKAALLSVASLSGKKQHSRWTYRLRTSVNHCLPVVSLVVNERDLFDTRSGIYAMGLLEIPDQKKSMNSAWFNLPFNFTNRGKEHCREAFFQFYERNILREGFPVMIGINGNATRAYPQKSMRVSRKKVGTEISEPPNLYFLKAKSFILRNGGNDWDRTLFSNAMQMELFGRNPVLAPISVFCALYINGEYWGIHVLTEKLDQENLAVKLADKKKKILIMEGVKPSDPSNENYLRFVRLIDQCKLNPDMGLQNLEDQIDVENFLQYLGIMIYVANADWPSSNIKCFKTSRDKWKWFLHDLDCAFGYAGEKWIETDVFSFLLKDQSYAGVFYRTLMRNKKYRNRLKEIINYNCDNITYPSEVMSVIGKYRNMLYQEMKFHINRWKYPVSLTQWEKNILSLKKFAKFRNEIVMQQVRFHLK